MRSPVAATSHLQNIFAEEDLEIHMWCKHVREANYVVHVLQCPIACILIQC